MPTLVDSNVLLDVVTEDRQWLEWSSSMLSREAERGRLVINPLVYAEVSLAFDRIEELDAAIPVGLRHARAPAMGCCVPRRTGIPPLPA